ncbi:MAG: hypothetical protein K1X89_15245 [Myxococcaceae bacterium]|nr:hypothetical protein [Myxococcaceae bacterium]
MPFTPGAAPSAGNRLSGAAAGHVVLPSLGLGEVAPSSAAAAASPTRTWSLSGRAFVEGPLSRGASTPHPPAAARPARVSAEQLEAAVSQAYDTRAKTLGTGSAKAPSLVTPEDGNVVARAYHLAVLGQQQFPAEFPLAMAAVGQREGFDVVVRVDSKRADALRTLAAEQGLTNVKLVEVEVPEGDRGMDAWSEDHGELHLDGTISVPRSLSKHDGVGTLDATIALFRDRMARAYPGVPFTAKTDEDLTALRRQYPEIDYLDLGVVSRNDAQRAVASLVADQPAKLRVANTYLEGGNTLVGRRAGGRGYALVGADSLGVSRAALEKDLGRKVSDAELKTLVAQDCGIAPADLVVVEQPKDFHLDMHMMLLPDGKVVLNDPLESVKLQKTWLAEDLARSKPTAPGPSATEAERADFATALESWQQTATDRQERLARVEERARNQAPRMDAIAKTMAESGLEVHRMAGVFEDTGDDRPMNFLNGEAALNPQRQKFYIALGGDPRAEAYAVQQLGSRLPSGFERIHFLDRELTTSTLRDFGGLSCRSKLEGTLP